MQIHFKILSLEVVQDLFSNDNFRFPIWCDLSYLLNLGFLTNDKLYIK